METAMDNSNLGGQLPGQPNMQNMPPNMQGMSPNMQMGGGAMGPNMMDQSYPQQAPRVKQPMDPVKKKRIIIIVSLIAALVLVGIALAVILPMLLRVDYSTAYNTVRELKPEIFDIYQSYDCEYVVDYVESTYIPGKEYGEYIDGCKELYTSDTDDLVKKLGDTDGIKRDSELGAQFDKFNEEYNALSAGNTEELDYKLGVWQAEHDFAVAVDDLAYNSSEAEITAAANYLIDSGSEELKIYGEGWLEWKLAIAAAYRDYNNASLSNYSEYQALRDAYNNKKKEYEDWDAVNKPDIGTLAPLNFDETSKMYSEFNKLYSMIAETYEKNYNFGSGDCIEFLGEAYCD